MQTLRRRAAEEGGAVVPVCARLEAEVAELDAAEQAECIIHLPYDVVVAKEFAANPPSLRTCNVHEVTADEMILDVGPQAVEALRGKGAMEEDEWAREEIELALRRACARPCS